MRDNPYAPPKARVADVATEEQIGETPFFAVSRTKFAIMCLTTVGLYELYWFYKNWRLVRDRERVDILPPARALFAVFFCYQLFARMRDYPIRVNTGKRLAAAPLAIGWTCLSLFFVLPDAYGLISGFAFLFLLPVQAHVNRLNAIAEPLHDRNTRLSGWNWLLMILGVLLQWVTIARILGRLPR